MSVFEQISCAVLAGGQSKRMGQPKQDIMINGRRLLELQTEKLRNAGFTDIMVSCAKDSDMIIPCCARCVKDREENAGPLEGIRSVLEASQHELCLIIGVDCVLADAELITMLVNTAAKRRSPITLIASEAGPEPLMGVYSKGLLPEASELIASGKRAVKDLFIKNEPVLIELDKNDRRLLNCNTPEDLNTLLKYCSEHPEAL